MKDLLKSTILIFACLFISACETIIPDTDTVAPEISLSLSTRGVSITQIASTDPADEITSGCPEGQSVSISSATAYSMSNFGRSITYTRDILDNAYYFPEMEEYTLLAVIRDQGGVENMSIWTRSLPEDGRAFSASRELNTSDEPQASPTEARDFSLTSDIEDIRPTDIVTVYSRSQIEPFNEADRPGEIGLDGLSIALKVSDFGASANLHVNGQDVLGNTNQLVAHLLPLSLCR
ncbi:MAG: hypothetical protein AAF583_05810 [Pseudomonadota bacterium]